MDNKPILKSKTFWVAAGMGALGGMVNGIQDYIANYPGETSVLFGAVMVALRFLTTNSVKLK